MSNAMELSKETLEQIGGYVRQNLGTWIRDLNPPLTVQLDPNSLERLIRVEEEVKFLRIDMNARFEAVDKRFEAVDRRFEETRADMNARFEERRADMNARFEETREEMNARFQDTRSEMNTRFDETREEMNARFHDTRSEMNTRFDETRADFKAGFQEARHHTNVWLSILTIVIAVTSLAGPVVAAFLM
ncbi:MAG: hypothetical protein ACOC37_01700 [Spirochaetota bacterium]